MTITDQGGGAYLVQFAPEEAEIIAWARAKHAPNILEEVLGGWLRGETIYREDQDIAALREGRADAPTRARVRVRLGL